MRRRQRSSPAKVVGAFVLLAVGVAVCIANLTQFGSAGAGPEPLLEPEPGDDAMPGGTGPDQLGDLLLQVGSYRQGTDVTPAFGARQVVAPGSVPAGETATVPTPRPAQFVAVPMAVTFVMVGSGLARACVDGQVVGVGARVAAGTVARIAKDRVEVTSPAGTLVYDLDDPLPRGHRVTAAQPAAGEPQGEADK